MKRRNSATAANNSGTEPQQNSHGSAESRVSSMIPQRLILSGLGAGISAAAFQRIRSDGFEILRAGGTRQQYERGRRETFHVHRGWLICGCALPRPA